MTKQELAELICTELSPDEWGEMAEILFDKVMDSYSKEEQDRIYYKLALAGVDVLPICNKKHPRPTV